MSVDIVMVTKGIFVTRCEALATYMSILYLKVSNHTQFFALMVWPSNEFQGPHNITVKALGHSVKWP